MLRSGVIAILLVLGLAAPAAARADTLITFSGDLRLPTKSAPMGFDLNGNGRSGEMPIRFLARGSVSPVGIALDTAELNAGGGKLTGTSRIDRGARAPAHERTHLSFNGFPLQAVLRPFTDTKFVPRALSGTVDLDGAWPIQAQAPTRVNGDLTASGPPPLFQKAGLDPIRVKITGNLHGQGLEVNPLEASSHDATLTAQGELPLGMEAPINLVVKMGGGEASERLLETLGLPLKVQGEIAVDGKLAGTLASPTGVGQITVHNVSLSPTNPIIPGLGEIRIPNLPIPNPKIPVPGVSFHLPVVLKNKQLFVSGAPIPIS